MPETAKKPREIGPDIVKILSALLVVLMHNRSSGASYEAVRAGLSFLFPIAVPAFIFINGYFLLSKPAVKPMYILKKAGSVLFCGLGWECISLAVTLITKKPLFNPLFDLLDSFMGLGHMGHFWFLGLLLILYALLWPLHWLFQNAKAAVAALAFVLLVGLQLFDIFWLQSGRDSLAYAPFRIPFRLWIWLPYFCLGGFAGSPAIKAWLAKNISRAASFGLCGGLFAALLCSEWLLNTRVYQTNSYLAYALNPLLPLFIFSLIVALGQLHYGKWAGFIGSLSGVTMGIFLSHSLFITAAGMVLPVEGATVKIMRISMNFSSGVMYLISGFLVFSAAGLVSFAVGKVPGLRKLVTI